MASYRLSAPQSPLGQMPQRYVRVPDTPLRCQQRLGARLESFLGSARVSPPETDLFCSKYQNTAAESGHGRFVDEDRSG